MNSEHLHTNAHFVGSLALPTARRQILVGVAGAIVFAALTFVGANIVIPLQPVPITLQTMFVALSGAILGKRFGALGQSLYLGAGVFGLPVFAGSAAGLAIVAGPTGGYLLGFLIAPMVIGALIRRRQSVWWQFAVFYVGSQIILGLGVLHLSVFYTHSIADALRLGYVPFIVGDFLKIGAAVSIYRSWHAIARRRA
jgi:biotin transport system substrate-specific component